MGFNPNMHHRRSIRLREYNYSQNGYYFVTICTNNFVKYLGQIKNGEMILNNIGEIVKQCWDDLPNHYGNCKLDEFIVMPNHVHGIIVIDNVIDHVGAGFVGASFVGASFKPAPTTNDHLKWHGLFEIVRAFKTFSARKINVAQNLFRFQWQRNYYEHVIRNENELYIKRRYIINNPMKWKFDKNNFI